MIVGYVRVSSKQQNTDRQIKQLEEYGCEKFFIDKESGKDLNRIEYQKMKKFVRKNDVVVFAELDRLGRSKQDINDEWNDLINKGVDIVILDMPILDTTKYNDDLGKLILNITKEIFSYIAEKDRLNILELQRQGIEIAKKKGKYLGRPIKYSENATGRDKVIYDKIIDMLHAKDSVLDISKDTGVSRNTIYKIKKASSQ